MILCAIQVQIDVKYFNSVNFLNDVKNNRYKQFLIIVNLQIIVSLQKVICKGSKQF